MSLSLVLFFCDYRFNCFDTLKSKLSPIVTPMQHLANWPVESVQTIGAKLADKKIILEKNKNIKEKLLTLSARLQRLDFLEDENAKLRSLLKHSKQIQDKILPAKTVNPTISSFDQQIIINKGKRDETYIGQPILDAHGLLGQIISITKKTSKVLLITNRKSAIPVTIVGKGLQTIAVGTGGNYLKLVNIPETSDITTGDFVVTSNLGGRFPSGYHVGTVKEVKRVLGERFMQVSVTPKANINKILHVLLIWTNID